jgi:hypothetical protein
MIAYLRATTAIASALILVACAATPPAAVAQNPACLTQTGSRIADNKTNCSAVGRSYSSEDIDRTGATTAGEALQLMDPSITVHH